MSLQAETTEEKQASAEIATVCKVRKVKIAAIIEFSPRGTTGEVQFVPDEGAQLETAIQEVMEICTRLDVALEPVARFAPEAAGGVIRFVRPVAKSKLLQK